MSRTLTRQATLGTTAKARWRWQHYLAAVGVVFLVWEAWTITSWLGENPYQVTEYRDRDSATWIAARIYEFGMLAFSAVLLTVVVRACRRERKWTFDAQLLVAGGLAYWLDPAENFFQPIFLYSSQWTNISSWCSQMPFVVNPDCGRLPEPWLFLLPVYSFGALACAIGGGWVLRAVRARRPSLSTPQAIVLVGIFGVLFDLALEYPMVLMHLWNYAGFPDVGGIAHGSVKYPLLVMIAAFVFWGGLASVRNLKNDKGETVFEQGLESIASPKRRKAVSFLALVGFMQLLILTADFICMWGGPFSAPYRDYPAHVVNGLCDTADGEVTGTRYGPCPGSPGYEMPMRRLPGDSPP